MILTDTRSPQQRLADTLGGRILGPSTILFAGRLVVASPLGVVRVDGCKVGRWSDGTDVLAAAVRGAV
jgi:hypothetical protein